MALEGIKDNCYFIDLDAEDVNEAKLAFQFVPKAFERNRSVNIDSVAIVGRNVPSYHYTGGETTISFELDFFAEEQSRQDVMRRCNWLEALTYNEGRLVYPHRVVVSFGKMFRNQVWVVKACSTTYSNFHKAHGFLPQQAYVRITLGLWAELPLNASDIKRGFDSSTDSTKELSASEAQIYLQNSIQKNSINSDNQPLVANQANIVANLADNTNARAKIAQSRRANVLSTITQGVDYAKLGIAISKF